MFGCWVVIGIEQKDGAKKGAVWYQNLVHFGALSVREDKLNQWLRRWRCGSLLIRRGLLNYRLEIAVRN